MPLGTSGELPYSVEDARVYPYTPHIWDDTLRRIRRREQTRRALPYIAAGLIGAGAIAGWLLRRWTVE